MKVSVRLQFVTPSLGSVRQPDGTFHLPRVADSRTICFSASWHCANLVYAAKLAGHSQHLASRVDWSVEVKEVGRLSWYKRYKVEGGKYYALHESIPAGGYASFLAALPNGLSLPEFERLLRDASQFRGLSPFGASQGFGRFKVIAVAREIRKADELPTHQPPSEALVSEPVAPAPNSAV